jgi:hypothetical protein
MFFSRSGMPAPDMPKGRQTLSARTVLLETGEKIETVKPNAFHGGLPVEAEGGLLALDPPAELPMGPDDERGNRAFFRNSADKPIRLRTLEQII